MVEAVGVETTPAVKICVFTRVSATIKRTNTHRPPSQLLQTATTKSIETRWTHIDKCVHFAERPTDEAADGV